MDVPLSILSLTVGRARGRQGLSDSPMRYIIFVFISRAFKDDHTGENFKEFFEDGLKEWGLPQSKVTSFTIDNGDNIRLAVDLLGVACMRCFGHTVQTGCTLIEAINSVKDLKAAAQKLLTFMSSTKVWNK